MTGRNLDRRIPRIRLLRFCPQLSSDDVSASFGEDSLQDEREEEEQQQESKQAPHPAGQTLSFCLADFPSAPAAVAERGCYGSQGSF